MCAAKKINIDELCINTLRMLSIDAVQKANSGHPGLPLGAAPMAYVLWNQFLKANPHNPHWFDRDRFVLSAGHGSMLLYSLLHLSGYDLSLDQIKQFRQWGSMTPGHPENTLTPGVEVTTGPLGQGFANGVGMAIGECYLAARYNRPDIKIIDHYTYGIVSDGDLMEGVSAEAASLAGHLRLGKLIYLYDDNRITLSASTQLTFTEDTAARFTGYRWHTQIVEDGNDIEAIAQAITAAREEHDRPSLIMVRTHIGYGSPGKQDSFEVHGAPLGEEEVKKTKEFFGWPLNPPFFIPDEALSHFRKSVDRGQNLERIWNDTFALYEQEYSEAAAELRLLMSGTVPAGWDAQLPQFAPDPQGMATRKASGMIMQTIAKQIPGLIGGSGDLNPSTFTELKGEGTFEHPDTGVGDLQGSVKGVWGYSGRNIFYGVREHAMGSISNGLATIPGLIPFASTFFIFSDYMRPSIRLAALMKLHVIYVFTHDSIALGEDGPTHQPVEQLASLRAIPNLIVIRPCDANETAVAWQVAIETRESPVALILTRQSVPTLDRTWFSPASLLRRGAYILFDAPDGKPEIILIASGSEVSLIAAAKQKIQQKGAAVRLVSMPSWDLFEKQPQEYKDMVLPPSVHARLSVEAASRLGWDRYVGEHGDAISMLTFGSSAPGQIVLQAYGFNVENICNHAMALLNRKN